MNYRHVYHAGNFADVIKHIILTRIVEYLKRKEQAFRVIDTHAGIGLYDLSSVEAQKTGEWIDGIGRLISAAKMHETPEEIENLLAPYLDAVSAQNTKSGQLEYYPGSPVITRHLLRKQDRLTALELHPVDARKLASYFEGDYQARITHLDGWLALGAYLPPKEKRGLVLIDPPFEIPGEFNRLIEGLEKAYKRFSGGTYSLWYPIKDIKAVKHFHQAAFDTGIEKILDVQLSVRADTEEARFNGTGMMIINPPYTLESELKILLPWLRDLLKDDQGANFKLKWIRKEGHSA